MIIPGDKNGFYFKVEKDGKTLIDSSHGPIIFEDQYVEVSLELGSYNCYGLGKYILYFETNRYFQASITTDGSDMH